MKRLIAFLALIAIAQASLAIEPRPPASIRIDDAALAALAANGAAVRKLPVRYTANSKLDGFAIEMRASARPVEAGKPEFERAAARVLAKEDVAAKRGKESALQIPLEGLAPGEYELEVLIVGRAVEGKSGARGGFSDRDLRHLTVLKDGVIRIQTVEQWVKQVQAQRERAFREALAKNPRSPRIKLLMGSTARLPANLSGRIQAADVPAGSQLIGRPDGLSADLKQYVQDNSMAAWSSRDPLTVRGQVVFLDVDNVWKPLPNVAIDIWDEDFGSDEYLGTTITDWSGNWTMSVNNNDGFLQDGRDIYYSFRLTNSRLHVNKCDDEYRWSSATHEDQNEGAVIDFGSETAGSEANSLVVWHRLNRAWNHATTVGGQDPGLVQACFPHASGNSTNRDAQVRIRANGFDGDGVVHEYGHAIMQKANGEDPSPGGPHGFGDCSVPQELAWSEGWATGFMLSAFPDHTYNWTATDTGLELENFDSACRTGETNEGWVAAALLDMLDSGNDDNAGNDNRGRDDFGDTNSGNRISLASMFRDTMWGNSPNYNMIAFWGALSGEISSAQSTPGHEIMYYDYMSVLAPGSCVATKVTTASLERPEPVLAGVRAFRDLVLKPVANGRELANTYYRNSPEIAVLLARNPSYLPDSLRVLQHFSAIGDAVGHHQQLGRLVAANDVVLPGEVQKSIERLMALLGKDGGRTLRKDLQLVARAYEMIKPLRWNEMTDVVGKLKEQGAGKPLVRIAPAAFSPESRKALEDKALLDIRNRGLPRPKGKR
jgi:hypothetical protein